MELPRSSLIIIVILIALVIITGLWKVLHERRSSHSSGMATRKTSRKGDRHHAETGTANHDAASPPYPDTFTYSDASTRIEEVSILDEVDIYLSYGHFDQAATSLRWYVDHNPKDIPQMRRPLAIYREIPDMDRFGEVLEKLYDSGVIVGQEARDLVLAGLHLDTQNLQLRVLAENLGMSGAQIEAEITRLTHASKSAVLDPSSSALSSAQRELKQAIVHPEPLDLSDLHLSGFASKTKASTNHAAAGAMAETENLLLVGPADIAPLNSKEYAIVASLISPLNAAGHLLACNQNEEAERLLRRNLILEPRKLALHVTLLEMLYHQRRGAHYAETLLQLYITLWGAGSALRLRLLRHGQSLGEHALWSFLADSEGNEASLASLAEQYGLYVPITAIPLSSPSLVLEEVRRDHQITPKDSSDSVLTEFNQLLEYGQVDEAVDLLEEATLAQPGHGLYYGPLLEMYERMDANLRFPQFIKKILGKDTQPNDEIMRQMFDLAERLQRRPQRQVI